VCKHILGYLIIITRFAVAPAAKTVLIGKKRKRGRPAKAKKSRAPTITAVFVSVVNVV